MFRYTYIASLVNHLLAKIEPESRVRWSKHVTAVSCLRVNNSERYLNSQWSSLVFRQPGLTEIMNLNKITQWPRSLRRRSAAAHLLGLRVRILPRAWMSVCCECCVWSGRGLCDDLITRPEKSYRMWCVWVWSFSLDNEAVLVHPGRTGEPTARRQISSVLGIHCCPNLFLLPNRSLYIAKKKIYIYIYLTARRL